MFNRLRDILKEKIDFWGGDIRDEDVMDFGKYDLYDAIQRCDHFRLCRYTPVTYLSIRNIEKQMIHLSPNGVMNDVYEGIPNFHKSLPYYTIQKLNDLASMTCFSENKDNTLMWSHYADSHKGICIEYDFKLLKSDPLGICEHLFPICYEDSRFINRNINSLIESHEILNESICKNYIYDGDEELDDIIPLFLTKSTEWKYEEEWRIIYSKKQMYDMDDETLYSGNLQFPCIHAIYLGYRIEPNIKDHLIEIVDRLSKSEGREIHIYQAKLENDGYKILFDEINNKTHSPVTH